MDVSIASGLANWLVCLHVADLAETARVRMAKLSLDRRSIAAFNGANVVHATSDRSVGQYVTKPEQTK